MPKSKNEKADPAVKNERLTSGITALDEAMEFLERLPQALMVGNKREKGDQPDAAKIDENLSPPSPDRPALIEAIRISHKLIKWLRAANERPGQYGTIFAVLPKTSGLLKDQSGQWLLGSKVRITSCQEQPEFVGKIGYIGDSVNKDGIVLVIFGSDSYGYFQAVSPDQDDEAVEIELVSEELNRAAVILGDAFLEFVCPDGLVLKTGDTVKISDDGKFIINKVDLPALAGEIATVLKLENGRAEVDLNGTTQIVAVGEKADGLEPGNRVLLDRTGAFIAENLGDQDEGYRFTEQPNVSWDDIGGQEDAKKDLRGIVEDPLDCPDAFRRFHKKPPKGALLLGPPGCGKTMLAKAAAAGLCKRHGESALKSGLFYIKGPEIFRSLVGQQEAILRHIFILANKHCQKHGYPAVIYIDECESIAKKRGTGTSGDHFEGLVQTLLTEMNDTTAIVIMATNRSDILDPAIVRHGRINRKIVVPRPDRAGTENILWLNIKNLPLETGVTAEQLAKAAAEEIFSDRYGMYRLTVVRPSEPGADGSASNVSEEKIFGLKHIISGAMIADGIVENAKDLAIERQKKEGQETFLTLTNLKAAIAKVFQGELLVDHNDDFTEYRQGLSGVISDIQILYHGTK